MLISKILEKAAESQITEHLISHNLSDPFQSAYRAHHSTKTALIEVLNDILKSRNSKKTVASLMSDISAAFDAVDHNILLGSMSSMFGIRNSALDWFKPRVLKPFLSRIPLAERSIIYSRCTTTAFLLLKIKVFLVFNSKNLPPRKVKFTPGLNHI